MKKKNLLRISMVLAVAAGLTACTTNNTAESTEAPKTSTESTKAAAVEEKSGESLVLRIMDSSDSTQERRKVFNEEFMQRHPEIKIEYTMMSGDQMTQTLTTAIKSGDAPDLFALPSGVKLSTAVSEGWYQSMSPYLTREFIDSFETGSLNEGVTTFDGEIYALPEAANIVNSLMFYNKDILAEAGLDPENPPETWSDFADACKKITEAGGGQYYGLIESGAAAVRTEIELRSFANLIP